MVENNALQGEMLDQVALQSDVRPLSKEITSILDRLGAVGTTGADIDYVGFEDRFRGSKDELRASQERYLRLFPPSSLPGRIIDIGCGRGEMTVHLARLGHEVTAVDYSDNAVELARSAVENAICSDGPCLKIDLRCADVNALELSGIYQLAVAADVVEHLAPAELDSLYSRIAAHLSPNGLFIVHTFPNAWYYRYEHARRLREARKLGAYLPLEPRTRYERLMHINEQSPRVLRRQLRSHFEHVLLWFTPHDLAKPFENLVRPFSKAEMRASGDLFAIASHAPLSVPVILDAVQMHPVGPLDVDLRVLAVPPTVSTNCRFRARLRVVNNSSVDLKSHPPNPVHLSYHCYSENGQLVVFDGLRTSIPVVKAGSEVDVAVQIEAPSPAGRYLLRLTLVQEMVRWFDQPPQDAFVDSWIRVTGTQ